MKTKRIPKTRKINGRVYRLYKTYGSEYDARISRDRLRKKGRHVRLITDYWGVGAKPYGLYVH
jgi:hypothetical protein